MEDLSGRTLEEIGKAHQFMIGQMKRASEECLVISKRLSIMADRLQLFQTGHLYYMKFRSGLNDHGDICETVFKVQKICFLAARFKVYWDEICVPESDPDSGSWSIGCWHSDEWLSCGKKL
jgi:hypothetical protein